MGISYSYDKKKIKIIQVISIICNFSFVLSLCKMAPMLYILPNLIIFTTFDLEQIYDFFKKNS